jgi:hypothetical protein
MSPHFRFVAVKLDDLLHDRRMTLTELAERFGMTLVNLSRRCFLQRKGADRSGMAQPEILASEDIWRNSPSGLITCKIY